MPLDALWTKDQIVARLAEAGIVLRRLSLLSDEARHLRRANRSSMPRPVRTIVESYNFEPAQPGLEAPS